LVIDNIPEHLGSAVEAVVEPNRRIVDPHHHLWKASNKMASYELQELWADTQSGHRIEKTVFVECRSSYRESGPKHLRPVGETEYAVEIAKASTAEPGKARIAAIVAHANLNLGNAVEEVLVAHEQAGAGLFRGIRHVGPFDPSASVPNAAAYHSCPYSRDSFREGLRKLGQLGYTFDAWHFHPQNREFLELARSVPETIMILDHFGTPLGVGDYADKKNEIYETWKRDIAEIAKCPNVYAKLGGLAMPDNGFGWHLRATAPTSDEFAEAQKKFYLHAIECFGSSRCMFESNFPVDKRSISYRVLWNGLKKIVKHHSEDEKDAMFRGTASAVYRI
jgi:L-fuconolactonase